MGNRLRETRETEGLTYAELARLCEVSAKVISEIERGRRDGKVETKRKILNGLNRNPHRTREWAFEKVFDSSA